jgi:plasmid segregation oscillating ATPase ParF
MKTIVIANTKGGVGKSTIACNLAVEGAKDGKKILLVDSDTQGSSVAFRACRDRDDIQAMSIFTPTLHKDLKEINNFDLIIIDAGGRDGKVFRSAILASDLVIIPILPSQYDIWAASDTMEVLKEARVYKDKLPALFVFNQVIQNTNVAKEADEAIKEIMTGNDVALANTVIYSRVAFKHSISKGLGVSEYEQQGKAAAEVKSLYNEIITY